LRVATRDGIQSGKIPPLVGLRVDPLRQALQALGLSESTLVVEKPWGLYADWHRSSAMTLKCLVVKPGHRMSLQRHAQREEVWRTLSGRGEDQATTPPTPLLPGRTHQIAKGALHRMANVGKEPLVVVEVQLGLCREDDIERLADDYKR
jgi:mannose-1-phosphate guanylyltransferase/mannose-6-phosphate isomerase